MTSRSRRKPLITILTVALVLTLPGVALAHNSAAEETTTETAEPETPEYQVTEVLSTLPLPASGLNVTIERDDTGKIVSVGVDDAGAEIVKEKDHKVVFLLSDGNTEVVVKSSGGFVQTKIKADDPADVTGDGAWVADVFGNGDVTIPYSVSFDGITPTIAVGTITTPPEVTFEIGEPKTKTSDDADKSFYKVKVKLTSGEETAKVSLSAKTYVNDEGETKVKVSVTLHSHNRVKCRDGHDRDKSSDDVSEWNGDDNDGRRGDRSKGDREWDHDGERDGDRKHRRDKDKDDNGDGDGETPE